MAYCGIKASIVLIKKVVFGNWINCQSEVKKVNVWIIEKNSNRSF